MGEDFAARLDDPAAVLLDGPMGTEIDRRGGRTTLPLWSAWALLDDPGLVQQVHEDNVRAGAEVLTANTFRTHRRSLAKAGMGNRAGELTNSAVSLARHAAESADGRVFVAGSIAPLEDCYSPDLTPSDNDLEAEHTEMAEHLAASGVDLVLVETMPTIREAEAATRAASVCGVPIWTGFTCGPDGALVSGESIAAASTASTAAGAIGVMVNCSAAVTLHVALGLLAATSEVPLAAYGNVGHAEDTSGWSATDVMSAAEYAGLAERWIELGARMIGGCCGTRPEHLEALRTLVAKTDDGGERA
ncbi:MAG: homocysteine S-methyltransferase family protein [Acidobacteria bacterium]|nr:homocysteine S-methyltransferase family protein [Acidobacteriota bacterium]